MPPNVFIGLAAIYGLLLVLALLFPPRDPTLRGVRSWLIARNTYSFFAVTLAVLLLPIPNRFTSLVLAIWGFEMAALMFVILWVKWTIQKAGR